MEALLLCTNPKSSSHTVLPLSDPTEALGTRMCTNKTESSLLKAWLSKWRLNTDSISMSGNCKDSDGSDDTEDEFCPPPKKKKKEVQMMLDLLVPML